MSIRTHFEDIAEAIREKLQSTDTFTPSEMPGAIRSISGGGFVPAEYSKLADNVINLQIPIDTTSIIECAFYANSYVNDGHIIGNMSQSSGNGFHLTTYNNRWYASNGSSEFNFAASSDYPLYGVDIIYRLEGSKVYMNGTEVATSNRGTNGTTYALNTRGSGVSTRNVYKYKYFKMWDGNGNLTHDISFGTVLDGALDVMYDAVTDEYRGY